MLGAAYQAGYDAAMEKVALNALKRHLLKVDPEYLRLSQGVNQRRGKLDDAGGRMLRSKDRRYQEAVTGKPKQDFYDNWFEPKRSLHERISSKKKFKSKPGWFSVIEHRTPGGQTFLAVDHKGMPIANTKLEYDWPSAHEVIRKVPGKSDTIKSHQRQGVMSALYDEALKKGNRLSPSHTQTDDAKALWAARQKKGA